MSEITEFNLSNFKLDIYSRSEIHFDLLIDNKLSIEDLHSALMSKIEYGWYAVVKEKDTGRIFLLNDHISSYRVYINRKTLKYGQNFWDVVGSEEVEIATEYMEQVKTRGYLTGENTIVKEVVKLLPSHIFCLKDNHQYYNPFISVEKKMDMSISQTVLPKTFLDKNSKIAVAFSGGLDSTFLMSALKKGGYKNIIPIYMYCPIIDNEADINLEQSKYVANKLGLPLEVVHIQEETLLSVSKVLISKYPNDCSPGFLALSLFLQKINAIYKPSKIITGQNSDTFISFGLTRKNHPIESLSRYLYLKVFRKIYNNVSPNKIEELLIKLTYMLRRIDEHCIPSNKSELITGWGSEKYYLPSICGNSRNKTTDYMDNLEYEHAVIYNKLVNHIAGNHSLIWSKEENVLMPFSNIEFIQYSYEGLKTFSLMKVLNPKKILSNEITFSFRRKKVSMLNRIINRFSSKANTNNNFIEKFKLIYLETIEASCNDFK